MSVTPIEETTKNRIGKLLSKHVSQYLQDEKHRQEFEEWYYKKYGIKYQWKIGSAVL